MSRRAPRPLALAVGDLAAALEPATPLAAVQRVWPDVVGPAIAEQAAPTAVRDGVVTVACQASVWASELELMGADLVARINAQLGSATLVGLRARATAR